MSDGEDGQPSFEAPEPKRERERGTVCQLRDTLSPVEGRRARRNVYKFRPQRELNPLPSFLLHSTLTQEETRDSSLEVDEVGGTMR